MCWWRWMGLRCSTRNWPAVVPQKGEVLQSGAHIGSSLMAHRWMFWKKTRLGSRRQWLLQVIRTHLSDAEEDLENLIQLGQLEYAATRASHL